MCLAADVIENANVNLAVKIDHAAATFGAERRLRRSEKPVPRLAVDTVRFAHRDVHPQSVLWGTGDERRCNRDAFPAQIPMPSRIDAAAITDVYWPLPVRRNCT